MPLTKNTKELIAKKVHKNIEEYEKGATLSNGRKIKSKAQAIAIGYSEGKKLVKSKKY